MPRKSYARCKLVLNSVLFLLTQLPVSSTPSGGSLLIWANPTTPITTNAIAAAHRFLILGSPSGRTRRGIPLRSIRLFSEVRDHDVSLFQIHRILHNSRDEHHRRAVPFLKQIVVLGQDGGIAVRDAVLSEITGEHIGRRHLQISRRSLRIVRSARFPHGDGVTLPSPLAWCGGRFSELEHARLRTGIGVDAQRVVVLPRDVKARRLI